MLRIFRDNELETRYSKPAPANLGAPLPTSPKDRTSGTWERCKKSNPNFVSLYITQYNCYVLPFSVFVIVPYCCILFHGSKNEAAQWWLLLHKPVQAVHQEPSHQGSFAGLFCTNIVSLITRPDIIHVSITNNFKYHQKCIHKLHESRTLNYPFFEQTCDTRSICTYLYYNVVNCCKMFGWQLPLIYLKNYVRNRALKV